MLGGAAANTGTLPSKTLRETALYLSGFRQRGLYGVKMSLKDKVTARDFLYLERQVQHSEHQRIIANLKRHQIDLYKGQASLVDAHTMRLENRGVDPVTLTADFVLIGTGSHPFRPPVFPFQRPRRSDTILNLRHPGGAHRGGRCPAANTPECSYARHPGDAPGARGCSPFSTPTLPGC